MVSIAEYITCYAFHRRKVDLHGNRIITYVSVRLAVRLMSLKFDMAKSSNAVVAVDGDFYDYRLLGITV